MAISEKKQKFLIIGLFVIILLIGAILYFGFRGGISVPAPTIPSGGFLPFPAQSRPVVPIESQIESIKLDSSILDTSLFKSLKIYGDLPIKAENKGRDNPFASF